MRYPFTPEILDALPEEIAWLYRELEDILLEEICSRLKLAGELNAVTVQDIQALRAHGIPLEEIKKAIAKTTRISLEKLDELLAGVAARNRDYYTEQLDLARVTAPARLAGAEDIAAIMEQTNRRSAGRLRSLPATGLEWLTTKAAAGTTSTWRRGAP